VLVTRAPDSSVGAWIPVLRGSGGACDFRCSTSVSTDLLPRGIAAGDADGDGRAEIFVSVGHSTLVQAWTSDARESDAPYSARAFDALGAGRGPLDLCLSDVDGDGSLDLCVSNAFDNEVSVLYGRK
jgi:hypothetical protein